MSNLKVSPYEWNSDKVKMVPNLGIAFEWSQWSQFISFLEEHEIQLSDLKDGGTVKNPALYLSQGTWICTIEVFKKDMFSNDDIKIVLEDGHHATKEEIAETLEYFAKKKREKSSKTASDKKVIVAKSFTEALEIVKEAVIMTKIWTKSRN